jgi:LacI family transcriptional regulator
MSHFSTMQKRKAGTKSSAGVAQSAKPISLKKLADHLGLAPATVSLVINGSPVAETISAETKSQIFEAARELNYRPNFFARCLRTRSSLTVGVIVPEVSEGYHASVLSGIEDYLLRQGYLYFVVSHRFKTDLVDEYVQLLLNRHIDGLVVINTPWTKHVPVPVVTVSSHDCVKGVTSIVLDHDRAAELALRHLTLLGHRQIAVIKGQAFVPDTEVRWRAIENAAKRMGLSLSPKLVGQIEDNSPLPHLGYKVTQKLLASGEPFTALFAFNDISAIGANRALHDFGLRVPQDVSVVGFDDIVSASFQNPALTTVQQPMRKMGRMAAETLLRCISHRGSDAGLPSVITVEPELVVRESTAHAPREKKSRKA